MPRAQSHNDQSPALHALGDRDSYARASRRRGTSHDARQNLMLTLLRNRHLAVVVSLAVVVFQVGSCGGRLHLQPRSRQLNDNDNDIQLSRLAASLSCSFRFI